MRGGVGMISNVKCYRSSNDPIPLIPIIENSSQKITKVIKTKISCSANPNHIIPIQINKNQIEYDAMIMDDILDMEDNKQNIINLLLSDQELSEEYSHLINSLVLDDAISTSIHIRILLDMIMWKTLLNQIFKDKVEKYNYMKNSWTPIIIAIKDIHKNKSQKNIKNVSKEFKQNIVPKIISFFSSSNFLITYEKNNNEYLEDKIVECYRNFSGIVHDCDSTDTNGIRKKRSSVKDIINGEDLKNFFLIVENALR